MPSQMEFDGKDVEAAAEKASKKLNIPAEKIKYSVISYGSTGIFGLVGAKKARIRVTVPDSAPQKPKKKRPAPPPEKNDVPVEETAVAAPAAPDTPEAADGPPAVDTVSARTAPALDEAAVEAGKEALRRIVDAITTEVSITVETNPERILFSISGGNSAILIGKRGQTLDAMQYLVEKIVNRQNDDRVRVQVDIEGYLESRKNNLKELAERLAEKVKRTGKPASAGQMNAHDRKIVHMALQEDSDVRSQSVGAGRYRKLVIFPKKGSQKEI